MERVQKRFRFLIGQFLILLSLLGTAFIFTNCSSIKQLFDLKGIIVSKDDQVFQGDSATVIIDISDVNKSYSFKATSDPVENGYPIKIESSNNSTVSIAQSASEPNKYTINAVRSGWCDVMVQCSVAYKFKFMVFITDKSKRITTDSLSKQRDEYYASLEENEKASSEQEVQTSTPATSTTPTTSALIATKPVVTSVQMSNSTPINVTYTSATFQVGKSCTFTAEVDKVTEPLSYQWYTENNSPIKGAIGKTYTITPSEAGVVSYYVQVRGVSSGVSKKSSVVSVEAVRAKVYVNPSTVVSIKADNSSAEVNEKIEFTSTIPALDEPVSYQWYVNNKPVINIAKTATQGAFEYTTKDACTEQVYLEITGKESGSKAKSAPVSITFSSKKVTISADKTSVEAEKEAVVTPSKLSTLEDFIANDEGFIEGRKIVTNTPKKYYNTTWLCEDETSGYNIDSEGFITEFKKSSDGSYVLNSKSDAKLRLDGTVEPRNYIYYDDLVIDGNTLSLKDSGKISRIAKKVSKINLRKQSYIDNGSKVTITCDEKTIAENETAMFYLDCAFDEQLSVYWYVSRNLKKHPTGEFYNAVNLFNNEPFYVYGLEEGSYEVYAVVTKSAKSTAKEFIPVVNIESNKITLTVKKAKDQQKRFVRDGEIWNPKNIYSVGEKCYLDVITTKSVKNVEWNVISLYGKTSEAHNYTEGTNFYFTCKNEGVYSVTAKINYKDGTSKISKVRVVSTVKNSKTFDGFWINTSDLDKFYNYTFPISRGENGARAFGYYVKDSKIFYIKDWIEESMTTTDFTVDPYPIAEFKNGGIVSLYPKEEFSYDNDIIYEEIGYTSEDGKIFYEKFKYVKVPWAKLQCRNLDSKKIWDDSAKIEINNFFGDEKNLTLKKNQPFQIEIAVKGDNQYWEGAEFSTKLDGKEISKTNYCIYSPKKTGKYVFETTAIGHISGKILKKKYTYNVNFDEYYENEEVKVEEWPEIKTNQPFAINPSKYYFDEKPDLYVYSATNEVYQGPAVTSSKAFLDNIREQMKTGIVRVIADNFTQNDMSNLNEVLKEAKNDFAIDFDECYGSYNTRLVGVEHVVCVKNAKRIFDGAFFDCPYIKKVTIRSFGSSKKDSRFIAYFGSKTLDSNNFFGYFREGAKKYHVPLLLKSVVINAPDVEFSKNYFSDGNLKTVVIRGKSYKLEY